MQLYYLITIIGISLFLLFRFLKKRSEKKRLQQLIENWGKGKGITRFFFIRKLGFHLLIKTFLRNRDFINKIFLTTFLIMVVENYENLTFLNNVS